jgi:hypothetical protein
MPRKTEPAIAVQDDSVLHYTNKRIPAALVDFLAQAKVSDYSGAYCLDLPQSEKEIYEAFKPLLKVLRGKWNGKTHVFAYDPTCNRRDR